MNKTTWLIINFLAFYILILLGGGIQSSLFHWAIGTRPTIQLVIIVLVYISLTRTQLEGLIFVVVACYSIGLLSVMMTSLSVFGGLTLFFIIQVVRNRVYSASSAYFMWSVLGGVFGFHLVSWIMSTFEVRVVRPRILDWILEVLLTALFVRPLYGSCQWVDKKTHRFSLTEINS